MLLLNTTLVAFDDTIKIGYANTVFMLLYFPIGLPWNTMVIGIILKKKLYSRPSVMLMFNLAITNLILCVSFMPITIIFGIGGPDVFGDTRIRDEVCRTGLLLVILPQLSLLTNTLMSVDRVFYLKKPLQYHLIVTPWRMFAAIVVAWVISIAVSLPSLFIPFLTGYSPVVATCTVYSHSVNIDTITPHWYFFVLVLQSTIFNHVQLVACIWIIYIVRKQLKMKLLRKISILRSRTQINGDTQNHQSLFNDYNKKSASSCGSFWGHCLYRYYNITSCSVPCCNSPLQINFISLPCICDPLQLQISHLPSHTSEIDS